MLVASSCNQLIRVAILIAVTRAREITFPAVLGVQDASLGDRTNGRFETAEGSNLGMDISASLYNGLTTYANLPYVHCLADGDVEAYDIAVLGAPFDTVGWRLFDGQVSSTCRW